MKRRRRNVERLSNFRRIISSAYSNRFSNSNRPSRRELDPAVHLLRHDEEAAIAEKLLSDSRDT